MPTIKEQDIFTKAYFDYKEALERYTFFKLNNAALGEDLVQETFMKTWRYIMRGGKIETMKAFLYHVLNGLIIDKYRKHKTASLDVLVEKGFDPREENESENIFNTLDANRALHMIELLPEKYKQLMHMKYVKNMTLDEITEVTGQSKNTAAVQINRGIQKLKKLYHHES